MVTEYIKRNQRMGYENGVLVYKVPADQPSPLEDYNAAEEEEVLETAEEDEDTPLLNKLV